MAKLIISSTIFIIYASRYVQSATDGILIQAGMDYFEKRSNALTLNSAVGSNVSYTKDLSSLSHNGWAQGLAEKKLSHERSKMKMLKSFVLIELCEGTWAILFPVQADSVMNKFDADSFQKFLDALWNPVNDNFLEFGLHGVGIACSWTAADIGKATDDFLVITFVQGTAIFQILWKRFPQVMLNPFLMAHAHTCAKIPKGKIYTFLSYTTALKEFDYDAILEWIWSQTEFPFENPIVRENIEKDDLKEVKTYGFTIYNGGTTDAVEVYIGIYSAFFTETYIIPHFPESSKEVGPPQGFGITKNDNSNTSKDLPNSVKTNNAQSNTPQISTRRFAACDDVLAGIPLSAPVSLDKDYRTNATSPVVIRDTPQDEELRQLETCLVLGINSIRSAHSEITKKLTPLVQCISGFSKRLTEAQSLFLAYPSKRSLYNFIEPFVEYRKNQGQLPGPKCKFIVASFSSAITESSSLCNYIIADLKLLYPQRSGRVNTRFNLLDAAVNKVAITIEVSEDSKSLMIAIVLVKN